MALTQTFNEDAAGNTQVTIAAGAAVIGHVIVDTAPSTAVTNAGTFATQSTLAAETTKVIGTVNLSAAQTLATVTTVSTVSAVTAITNALPAGTNVLGHVIVDSGSISTAAVSSATGTHSSVAGSVTSVTLLASNAARKGFTLYNDSASICKVALTGTASASIFSVLLQPNAFFENGILYTGAIAGIWTSAVGNMRVVEFT